MANVYAWPPVAAVSKFWNLDAPVSKSYSMTSGRRFASSVMLPRRRAKVTVHGRRQNGLGYMAALERLLAGGINFVRLTSCRMAFGQVADFGEDGRQGQFFNWREINDSATNFAWNEEAAGPEFLWFEGLFLQSNLVGGAGGRSITITGPLPRNAIIALPGEFITVYTELNPNGEVHMVTNLVMSNNSSTTPRSATIKLATPVSGPGRVDLNTSETGIFELNASFPDLGRSGDSIPDLQLDFREVFPQEIPEGLVEVNPWT